MPTVRDLLACEWNRCGLKKGDTVLIHSSLVRTFARFRNNNPPVSPQDILNSFLDAVGSNGTLVFPLFNFHFTKGVPFDIRSTPSRMGVLTEAARILPTSVRTGHPIYSFAAIGANKERFNHVNNYSGYSSDSPFGIIRELNAKIAVLDIADQESMTFIHHVEEMYNVPYRYHKKFTGKYMDYEGITTTRTYGLFVRNLDQKVLTHVNPAGELMWENGLYHGDKPGHGAGLRWVSAREMFKFVSEIIDSGKAKGLLYCIEGEQA